MARHSRRLEKDARRWHADNDDWSVCQHDVHYAVLSVWRRIAKRVTYPLQLSDDFGPEFWVDGERFRTHHNQVDELHAIGIHGKLGGTRLTSCSNSQDCFQCFSSTARKSRQSTSWFTIRFRTYWLVKCDSFDTSWSWSHLQCEL